MKKTGLVAVLATAAIMLSSCGGNATLKKTAMEIGDVKVTAADIAVMTDLTGNGGEFDTVKDTVEYQVKTCFEYAALAKVMGIELDDKDKKSVIELRAQYASNVGGRKAFEKYLQSNGSSLEFVESLFSASMLQSKVVDKLQEELDKEEITDEDIKNFYNEKYLCAKHILISNPAEGETPEKDPKALAEEILERAKNGEDFDKMAKEYSTDPGLEANPDGYVFTDGEMVKPFEDGVKALKSGELGLCETDYGYHILLRLDLPEFNDEVKSDVEGSYKSNRMTIKAEDMLKENGINVVVNDDVIDAIAEDMIKKADVAEEPQIQY